MKRDLKDPWIQKVQDVKRQKQQRDAYETLMMWGQVIGSALLVFAAVHGLILWWGLR